MVFISVELIGGVELAAQVEKAVAGPRAAEGYSWREGEGGRLAGVLGRGGDASRRSGGAVESAVAEATWQSAVAALR